MSGESTLDVQLKETIDAIKNMTGSDVFNGGVAIILGSGLGDLAQRMDCQFDLPYADIPHFSATAVSGHAGRLHIGEINKTPLICLNGRFHFYEGHSMAQVTYPVRLLAALGVKTLIVTNAAGGINAAFEAGDLMMINDHLNLMGKNPLMGANNERFGPRFPDMSEAYSVKLRQQLKQVASENNISLQEGVYAAVSGPSYETPAEVRMLQTLGADAVGMSTVPEVIVANHCGMQVAGVSCITNVAAGLSDQRLSHDEVIETGRAARERFSTLMMAFLNQVTNQKHQAEASVSS